MIFDEWFEQEFNDLGTKFTKDNLKEAFNAGQVISIDDAPLNLGTVSKVLEFDNSILITISDDTWAPGIWAGCEGLVINLKHNYKFETIEVFLTKKQLLIKEIGLNTFKLICIGDTIEYLGDG